MSHSATIWALQQRGLTPAQRVVLFYLADRHNPDYGCFPSQAQLAADCEISRSGLNKLLDELQDRRLIRRERRVHPETHRQMSTRYILGFEKGFEAPSETIKAPDPCPETGHGNPQSEPVDKPKKAVSTVSDSVSKSRVHNLDTNLVSIQPVSTTTARASDEPVDNSPQGRCLAAAGRGLCPAGRQSITVTAEVIDGWLAAGFDLELDVLPVIASRTVAMRISPIRTWAYFSDAVREAHRSRVAKAERARNAENSMVWGGRGGADRQAAALAARSAVGGAASVTQAACPAGGGASGSTSAADGKTPTTHGDDPVLRFHADWVNGDRYLPQNAISNRMASALLKAGLVSRDRMRARGVPFVDGGR